MHSLSRVHYWAGLTYLLILATSAASGLWHSLAWPITTDGSIFTYVLWRVENGAVLYRDIFENNMPGTYLFQWLAQSLFGSSDIAFRLFDITFLLATGALIIAFCHRTSRIYACVAALFFINVHLSEGMESAAQRDYLMVPFLLCAAYCLRAFLQSSDFRPKMLCIIGLLCGFAFWIKPLALVFAALIGFALCWHLRSIPNILRAAGWGLLGFLIPTAIIHVWLYQMGSLSAFYDMLTGFLLPVYSHIHTFNTYSWPVFLAVLAGLSYVLFKKTSLSLPDKIVILLGLTYGVIHFCGQHKGWFYHFYPMWGFLALTFACAIPAGLFNRAGNAAALHAFIVLFAVSLCAVNISAEPPRDHTSQIKTDVQEALDSIPESVRAPYLATHPHNYLHFFDFTRAHLFRAAHQNQWVTTSRHIYPFALYNAEWEHPTIQNMANELISDLRQHKPLIIIVSREAWPWELRDAKSYEIIESHQPWKDFFAQYYRLHTQSENYRIYVRTR